MKPARSIQGKVQRSAPKVLASVLLDIRVIQNYSGLFRVIQG